MGWGLVSASRGRVFGFCTGEVDTADAMVVDMCSECRRVAVGPNARSARSVAYRMCDQFWKRVQKTLVLVFDDPDKMHPVRSELHAVRYKPVSEEKARRAIDSGKVVIGGQIYAPNMVPYTKAELQRLRVTTDVVWPRMWATAAGKARAFQLLQDASIMWHHANTKIGDGRSMILWSPERKVTYPYHCEAIAAVATAMFSNMTFGEADFQCSEAVKHLAASGSVIMQTIDTDMIIQMVASLRVTSQSTVHLRLLNETLCINKLVENYGDADADMRLSSAFFMLCCNGVDYCRGLSRFGFMIAGMLDLAGKAVVVSHDAATGMATLDVHLVLQALGTIKVSHRKGQTWADFGEELHRIMFCLSFFSGACRSREPYGGPDLTEGPLFTCGDLDFNAKEVLSVDASACTNITVVIGK